MVRLGAGGGGESRLKLRFLYRGRVGLYIMLVRSLADMISFEKKGGGDGGPTSAQKLSAGHVQKPQGLEECLYFRYR